jgi:hypothetical protein
VTERGTAQPPVPAEGAAWLDEGAIATDWSPPVGDPPVRRGIPGWAIWTAGLLVLLLLGVVVWGLGGFRKRTDLLRPTPSGTTVNTGPYELTFIEATAQADLDEQGRIERWEVIVIGTGRTTGNQTENPRYFGDSSMFAAKDPGTGEIQGADSAALGAEGRFDQRAFTPGLPPIRYALTFVFSPAYQPQPTVQLAVAGLEFTANYLTSEEKSWNNAIYGFRYDLPVTVLQPKEY